MSLAFGVTAYFALPREPSLWVLTLFAAIFLVLSYRARHWVPGGYVVLLLAVFASGILLGKVRSEWVATPILQKPIAGAVIDGWVESIDSRRQGGYRILIRVANIDRLNDDETPYRVRVNLRQESQVRALRLGSRVSVRGWIGPPPGPAAPGDFDFSRNAYFQKLGAVGTAFSVNPSSALEPAADWRLRFTTIIGALRVAISARIRDALPGEQGALAAALITGRRGDISNENVENLRTAGLAHILAISGLHMSLAAGSIFVIIRALLALFPPLVLHYPVKKIAAVAAIIGAAGYLVISGASIATQRAFIMISIMLLAVLLDRPAITMRNVALAALTIIIMRPEAVLTPSFRMSFSAVTALVAAYEYREMLGGMKRSMTGLWVRISLKPIYYLAGVSMTTIVAAASTAPFAAYHFHHMAPFALAGNLLGIPVIAFLIMPAALFSVIAMGFGLEVYPLAVMGAGITWLLDIAATVAGWPGAVRMVSAMPDVALLLIVSGGLWMALWRTSWRLAGSGAIIGGIALMWWPNHPDLLVDSRARTLAVRDQSGQLQILVRGRSTFAAERWLERDGDMRGIDQVGADNFTCDKSACIAPLNDAGHVAMVLHRAAMAEECRTARIVIFTFNRRGNCIGPELIVDQTDLEQDGSLAVWTRGEGINAAHSAPLSAARPWRRRAPEEDRWSGTRENRSRSNNESANEPKVTPGKPL